MKKILCLHAHPNPSTSRANKRISEYIAGVPGVTFRSLYEIYPEFNIDVKAEQKLLLEHDVLMFQHPFYWYSMPPLLKLWVDTVLEFNFAYGPKGKFLHGKEFLLSITTGGPHESYRSEGYNRFTVDSFFPPYIQTARLCGMKWREPLVLHHALHISEERLSEHGRYVRHKLEKMTGGD